MLSSVSRTSFMSLRLAPSTARPTGTPAASTSTLRLTPRLARSVGFLPVFFPPEGSLGHAAIHAYPLPIDPFQAVVFQQARLPHLKENAGLHPLLKAIVSRRSGTELGGIQGLPLAAGAQHKENGVHTHAVGSARTPPPKRCVFLCSGTSHSISVQRSS